MIRITVAIMWCLSLLFVLSISHRVYAANVCIQDMSVKPGSNIEIPVTVDDASGITSFEFLLGYDPLVLDCSGVTDGDLTSGWVGGFKQYRIQMKVIKYEKDLIPLAASSGTLLNFQCKVLGSPGSLTNVCLKSATLGDKKGNEISSTRCECAQVKVIGTMGDLNWDDEVDISDVILVLRLALKLDPPKSCSDINADGLVDISDVILTLRMALGLDPLRPCL